MFRKITLLIAFCFTFLIASKAQSIKVEDLSGELSLNYVLANMEKIVYSNHALYDRSFFVSVYTISDSKATPSGLFEEADGILSSVLVSIVPDGDFYVDSKLFKIEGILNPVVETLKETKFPEFSLSIAHGKALERKLVKYTLRWEE